MAEGEGKYDGIFYQIIQQNGGYEGLFGEVFSFMRRKTDFFSDQAKAQKCTEDQAKKHAMLWIRDEAEKKEREKEQKVRDEKRKAQLEKEAEEKKARDEKKKQEQEEKAKNGEVVVKDTTNDNKTDEEKKKEEEDNEPAPKGNGGQTDRYVWTQTLDNTTITIQLESTIKSKDLEVKLTNESCFVRIKGQEPTIDGKWPEMVDSTESNWTLETLKDGKELIIFIQKWANRNGWWDCAIKGDAKINTQKINPETSKVSDLDGEMKGTVEKMMFDMRQKQQGLPSSDELEKRSKIEQFMKAHPEMDFSKAKFC